MRLRGGKVSQVTEAIVPQETAKMDQLVVGCRHGRHSRVRQILDAQTGGSGHSSVISVAKSYTSLYYSIMCTVEPAQNTQQVTQQLSYLLIIAHF